MLEHDNFFRNIKEEDVDVFCVEDFLIDAEQNRIELILFNQTAFFKRMLGENIFESVSSFFQYVRSSIEEKSQRYLRMENLESFFVNRYINLHQYRRFFDEGATNRPKFIIFHKSDAFFIFDHPFIHFIIDYAESWFMYWRERVPWDIFWDDILYHIVHQYIPVQLYKKTWQIVFASIVDFIQIQQILLLKQSSPKQKVSNLTNAAIVNVGFGNCCLVYGKTDVVAIDFSNSKSGKVPKVTLQHIHAAKSHIISFQRASSFHINSFVLTHPHFDHYSGVYDLVTNTPAAMGPNTDFFINLRYFQPVGAYTRMLHAINNANVNLVDPIRSNSIGDIEILHPRYDVTTGSENNASVIVQINVAGNNKCIFPGDLQFPPNKIGGWYGTNSKTRKCVKNCNFYVVSHHGSSNGDINFFPKNAKWRICSYKKWKSIPDATVMSLVNWEIGNNVRDNFIDIDFMGKTQYL